MTSPPDFDKFDEFETLKVSTFQQAIIVNRTKRTDKRSVGESVWLARGVTLNDAPGARAA